MHDFDARCLAFLRRLEVGLPSLRSVTQNDTASPRSDVCDRPSSEHV